MTTTMNANEKTELKTKRQSKNKEWYLPGCPNCGSTIYANPNRGRRTTCRTCRFVWFIRPLRQSIDDEGRRTFEAILRSKPNRGASAEDVAARIAGDASSEIARAREAAEAALTDLKTEFADSVKKEALAVAREAAEKIAPVERVLVAPVKVKKKKKVSGDRHKAYDETLTTITAIGQTLLVGPAGTGKSTLASQIAADLDLDFGFLPCGEGLSEAHILGRMNMNGEYMGTSFIDIFENGGIFLFDEIDGGDANTLLSINEALANGRVSVPNRPGNPIAKRHPECLIIAAANTFGQGSDMEYVGRNQLDAAFLDRFAGAIVEVDYDLERERSIAKEHGIESLVEPIWKIRANVTESRIRRPVTTRWFVNLGKLRGVKKDMTDTELLDRCFVGWTTPEREKALAGVRVGDGVAKVDEESSVKHKHTHDKKCPGCGKPMVRRVASRGARRGLPFWGCTGYPVCTKTINISEGI